MLHTYDERIAKIMFEPAPESCYTLSCCGREIGETDFLDNQGIEYYQSKKGDIWCADCIKSAFDVPAGVDYIRQNNLEEDFKQYLPADLLVKCTLYNSTKALEGLLKAFCFDDLDSWAEWVMNEYKE